MIPKFLSDKDEIYLVAPSFGATIEPYKTRLKMAIKNFKTLGYKVTEGANVHKANGVASSNTKRLRAKEINEAFKSNATAVISVGGGELMCEILNYIDFDLIKNNPKWFMGFSDNTHLCYTITTLLDIETIYGINFPSFYLYPFEYDSLDSFLMLKGKTEYVGYDKWQLNENENKFDNYNFDMNTEIINVNNFKEVQGRIIGGCLDCLINLCGTKFDKTKEYIERHKKEGIIFFFEACDLNTVGVIRALNQLKMAGWFKNVSAILIGRSNNYNNNEFGINMIDAYDYALKELKIPMLINVPISHKGPTMPIRVGAKTKITFDKNLIIKYE